ncbi:MAG TPA: hypothetical protein VF599_15475 [Pyrinomonadaceae bacterium]|jgi:tetratricopeptide (TPR) repeat protein
MTEDEKIKIEPDFNRALQIWHEGKPLEAIGILKNLDKNFPNQASILGMIGGIYFSLDDWKNSYIYYKKTAELSPKSETASIGLFHSLFELKKYDESFNEIKRFLTTSKKLNIKLKKYNLLINDWKKEFNLQTDDYFEITEAVSENLKTSL